jgi:hypothetical protein
MKPISMGLAKVLVGLGFVLEGVAPLPLYLALTSANPADRDFYWIASAVGFALLGAASWAWMSRLSRTENRDPGMRLVLWIFAIACLVLGVAYLGFLNELREFYQQAQHPGLRRAVISDSLSLFGFCLAALGFWCAGRTLKSPPDSRRTGVEPTPSKTDSLLSR